MTAASHNELAITGLRRSHSAVDRGALLECERGGKRREHASFTTGVVVPSQRFRRLGEA